MADRSVLELPIGFFNGDNDAQLAAGDVSALLASFNSTWSFSFDDTEEMAIVSQRFIMPTQYTGGTLKALIGFFMASDNTNDIALEVFVEAVTPDTDTIDLETATGWDSANAGTVSLAGSTAGDPLSLTITLTNKDGVAAGDLVRIGIRRNTISANDDAAGLLYITSCQLLEA